MPEFFEKFIFEPSQISEWAQFGKAVDVTSENDLYFNFCGSCLYTFNPLSLLLKWVTTLVETAYRNMENRQSCGTTYMMRIKKSERRLYFNFQMGYCLHDSYQADEIVTETKEWKQSSRRLCQKLQKNLIKCLGDISCILKKLYYMNFKFGYS